MRRSSVRKGSALLIVLGMLAFMVVSAVGFSVYMRQSRAPSSYLRRNIAARYLVKAALANAIEDLEGNYNDDESWGVRESESYRLNQNRFFGVYDDPYPGCGEDAKDFASDVRRNGDYWFKRVFCPFGPVGEPTSASDALDPEKQNPTVPTLTLEALAYLPPAIVDDVRKVSRLTRTACWRPLSYDAGRFAYTAVNVSDFFDINRLRVEPRNSGLDRVSLTSLCGTNPQDPTSLNAGDASALKQVVERWMNASPDAPFVSLADFALVNSGSDYSPFTSFVGGSTAPFLSGGMRQEANALFITDTWFPATAADASGGGSGGSGGGSGGKSQNASGGGANNVVYDLAGGHQPFKPGTFGASGAAHSFLETLQQKNPQDNAGDIFEKNLGIGLACLYDYLDRDQTPISLCLPTTEAVPMVVAVSAPAGLGVQIGSLETVQDTFQINGTANDGNVPPNQIPAVEQITRKATKYGVTSFAGAGQVMVKILTTYPFKRMATLNRTKSYQVRGLMRVYLAKAGMGCRLGENQKIRTVGSGDWQNGIRDGVATFVSDQKAIGAFNSDVRDMQSAVDDSITLTFSSLNVQMPLYWEVDEQSTTPTIVTPGALPPFTPTNPDEKDRPKFASLGALASDPAAFRPLDANGNFFGGWTSAANGPWSLTTPGAAGAAEIDDSFKSEQFRIQASIWIQVLDGGKVVDMVPACVQDDIEWLDGNPTFLSQNEVVNKCGSGTPLLNFQAADEVSYSGEISTEWGQKYGGMVKFQDCATLYAVDPRYNWAPENWYATDDAQADKTKWIDFVRQNYLGKDGRDRDFFMFVSDQEYLQDIGELQFLPYLQEMNGSGNFLLGDYSPRFSGDAFSTRRNGGSFANGNNFWRTYTAYNNGDGSDPIYALPYSGKPNGVRFHSGVGGFKLNPYSDDDRVLFAALVGTPFDYYVASTNENSSVKRLQNVSLQQMLNTYSFGQSSVAKISNDEMLDLAGAIRDALQDKAKAGSLDWAAAWDDLKWQEVATTQIGDDNKKLFGIDLQNALHGVDRKFLYSFWRECFDNRQQLFLVFVRAEPSAVGGGASGNLASAQLGGRAVALVWRDPSVPTYQNKRINANGQLVLPRRNFRGSGDSVKKNFRKMKSETPAHRTRVLFYHQFD